MRNFTFLLPASFCLAVQLHAQKISGSVSDAGGNPVNGATISLLLAKDSSVIKWEVVRDGRFSFGSVKSGAYLVNASHTGYATAYSQPVTIGQKDVNLPLLVLQKEAKELSGMTVYARKPLVETKGSNLVLNVEGTINATGSDALELLRKAPGIATDKDDNLSISGKNGVQVFIDGRPTPLTGQELSNYLKTLSSAQIEAIEILNNPPASYEAAGNGGIINIRLKKNRSYGLNGSANGGWNIGTFAKYNSGFSLNYRNKKLNYFGTYNYSQALNENYFHLYRVLKDSSFDQNSYILSKTKNHNFKQGVDLFLNAKNTLGIMVNGAFSNATVTNTSHTPIAYQPDKSIDRIMVADNKSDQENQNINVNLNYTYRDTSGKSLAVNGDYGFYNIHSNQLQPNRFFDPSCTHEISSVIYNIVTPTEIDIYSLKADYEQNLGKGKLGLGGKTSFVSTDNRLEQYFVQEEQKELDPAHSNRFRYRENIHAGYVTYSAAFKGVQVQGGLRVENTSLKGTSEGLENSTGQESFSRNYTGFFPSASLTFNRNPQSVIGFSYSRRIDRPAYQDLNPFEYKINEYTFHKGNINLQPQYTSSFGITHTYRYRLTTSLNYSHVRDMFAQIVDTAEGSKSYLSSRNLASQDITSLTLSYPFQYKAYSLFANVNTYYARYQADYGPGRKIDQDIVAVKLYAQNSIRFAGTWTAEISAFYQSPAIWQGSLRSQAMWSADGGIQKQMLQGKGNLKLSVSDLFHSLEWKASNQFAGQYMTAAGNWESRQLKLNFTYRFGNHQVKAARDRNTGAEDENKRVQTGGESGLGH